MASAGNSGGRRIPANSQLYFLIRHIFLPPKLPHASTNSTANKRKLMETVYDALTRFRLFFNAAQTPVLDRCIQMLKCMMDAYSGSHMRLDTDVLKRQITVLGENDCLAVYVSRHNAGLLLTRVGSEMRFEALQLLAPDDIVLGCEGRLRRHFPARAAAVGRHHILRSAFLEPFLDVLQQLDPEAAEESYDTPPTDPKLVTDMVMGVLRGIGRDLTADEAVCISKCSREETLKEVWPDKEFSWRRSPLWLLIRVVIQLTLDRAARQHGDGNGQPTSLYKAFMIFLMSSVLKMAARGHVSHDLLFFMKAKISRRVLKLGPAATEAAWYGLPHGVLRHVDITLTESWDAIQSPKPQALPLSHLAKLDIDRDTVLPPETLKQHLGWVKQRKPAGEIPDGAGHALATRHSPFLRSRPSDPPRESFRVDGEIGHFELADFESWVEDQIERRVPLKDEEERKAAEAACHDGVNASRVRKTRLGDPAYRLLSSGRADDSEWVRYVDNGFARDLWARSGGRLPHPHPAEKRRASSSRLCEECAELRVHDPSFERFINPSRKSEDCELCRMLHRALWPHGTPSARPVRVFRQGTNLWADGDSRPLLRLCVGPEWSGAGEIQVGLPQLLARSGPEYYELLRSWIRRCDNSHQEFGCYMPSQVALPSRVIDVGDGSGDKNHVRLVCTNTSDRGQYVALSHCWGKPSAEEKETNCTSTSNLGQRCRGINVDRLGKTFQDAIAVTRGLGQRYLWIDSLCIIQNDDCDWMLESARMGAVFSFAYCVIAATAARSTHAGFLQPPRAGPGHFIALSTPSSTPLYLCETVDDFRGDVEHAGLSRRGWVLQERALARRTIHFSNGQTYWECGRGIQCESLTLLNNKEAMFLGDPQFPKLAMVQAATSNALHHVFQVVFKKYSRLELTRATDRPIAVAGVERRLADEMGSSVTFGVFTSFEYLHRSLLWRRAGDVLHWIEKNTPRVPTWSWMSFIGPIDYVEITSTEMEWNRDICLSTTEEPAELMAPITTFAAKMLRNPSLLILDYRLTADVENLKCVVIGKELSLSPSPGNQDDEVCYVLVVSPVQTCGTCIQYERLGVATLHKTHLALEHGTERARII